MKLNVKGDLKTISIDKFLHQDCKIRAIEDNVNLKDFIETALRQALVRGQDDNKSVG